MTSSAIPRSLLTGLRCALQCAPRATLGARTFPWFPVASSRTFSDAASNRPNSGTPPDWKPTGTADKLKEPAFVRGLEQKAMDELEDLHVDAVDDDEEMELVDGKHTFSWKVGAWHP